MEYMGQHIITYTHVLLVYIKCRLFSHYYILDNSFPTFHSNYISLGHVSSSKMNVWLFSCGHPYLRFVQVTMWVAQRWLPSSKYLAISVLGGVLYVKWRREI